jgi:hypothetical protein
MYGPLKERRTNYVCEGDYLTLSRVILNLIGNYHTTHATPPTLRLAADRFRELGHLELADFLEEKIQEETGHDLLALKDLRALGLPAEQMVEVVRPQLAIALVDYFEAAANADNPIGVVGYSFALERNALFIGQEYIDMVDALCPPGVMATRCLRVHSGIGADASHVAEMVEFIATLSNDERLAVIQAVYDTTQIIATTHREDEMNNEEIEYMLDDARREAEANMPVAMV